MVLSFSRRTAGSAEEPRAPMQPPPKRTKIVATAGPASRDPAMLRSLFLAGVNVIRLNFSHGTHDDHAAIIADVRRIAKELGLYVAILQDLPGPKVRTGTFADGTASVRLETGSAFTLTTEQAPGDAEHVSVSYAGLARDVEVGKRVYLADGAIALRVTGVDGPRVKTVVETGGELRERQGINYPDGTLELDAVTDRDLEHLDFGMAQDVDWVAVSFVRTAQDVAKVKNHIGAAGKSIPVMAKIEKHEALEHIDDILQVADGIMVARGDLGIEIPLEEVPLAQKDLIHAREQSLQARRHRDADARVDDLLAAPHARGGDRRRQRDPRRHRRGDALRRDRARRLSARSGARDGDDRGASRGEIPVQGDSPAPLDRLRRHRDGRGHRHVDRRGGRRRGGRRSRCAWS